MVLSLITGLAGRTRAAEVSLAGLLDDMTNLTAMAEFPNVTVHTLEAFS